MTVDICNDTVCAWYEPINGQFWPQIYSCTLTLLVVNKGFGRCEDLNGSPLNLGDLTKRRKQSFLRRSCWVWRRHTHDSYLHFESSSLLPCFVPTIVISSTMKKTHNFKPKFPFSCGTVKRIPLKGFSKEQQAMKLTSYSNKKRANKQFHII